MCGRFVEFSPISKITKAFDIARVMRATHKPNYNVAPGQNILAVAQHHNQNILTTFRWGLIPSWSKDPNISYKMINARSETLDQKASFKTPFKKYRCLIVADGFYEWQKQQKEKIPFYITLKQAQPFAFAGLYSIWNNPEKPQEKISTCTIITTKANKLIKDIHHRMPVILDKKNYQTWLDTTNTQTDELKDLFQPLNASYMTCYQVSTQVNKPANNTENNIKPLVDN